MSRDGINHLLAGFQKFRRTYFEHDRELYADLVKRGQSPKVLLIACSDSRVDPAILTHCAPGELFILRNVAALVPPYRVDSRHHGTSAGLEFAVRGLNVQHIVVLGHALCGGIRALRQHDAARLDDYEFLNTWMKIAAPAHDAVLESLGHAGAALRQEALEKASIVLSLNNLFSFPWIRERHRRRKIFLHGWYFDLRVGELFAYDAAGRRFAKVKNRATPVPAKQLVKADIDMRRFLEALNGPDCGCEHRKVRHTQIKANTKKAKGKR